MARMMHPLHGWHDASAADDIPAMRRNGWVDDDGAALSAKLAPNMPPPAPAVVEAAAVVKRGPGRPRKVVTHGG